MGEDALEFENGEGESDGCEETREWWDGEEDVVKEGGAAPGDGRVEQCA